MFNIKCVILGALSGILLSIPITLGIINIHEQFKTDQFKQAVADKYNFDHRYDFSILLNAPDIKMTGNCSKGKFDTMSIIKTKDNVIMDCIKYRVNTEYSASIIPYHFGPYPIQVNNEGHITEHIGTIGVIEVREGQ